MEEIRNRNIQKNAEFLTSLFGLPIVETTSNETTVSAITNSITSFPFFNVQFECDLIKICSKSIYARNEVLLEIINYLDNVSAQIILVGFANTLVYINSIVCNKFTAINH